MKEKIEILKNLYTDYDACASKFGLKYCEDTTGWIERKKAGTGFYYIDSKGNKVDDKKILKYIEDIVIPPKWENTLISPDAKNHMLAVGFDDKQRKQYIYNEDWTHARNLINSYKMILFGNILGPIRKQVKEDISEKKGSYKHVIATLILTLDETVIRVGNTHYYEENDTVGLTTLHNEHLSFKKDGTIAQLDFTGKSAKDHCVKIKKKKIVSALKYLKQNNAECLFVYKEDSKECILSSDDVNKYLHNYGSDLISAKDFRTWHATRIVFKELIHETQKKDFKKLSDTKRNKILLECFDLAAEKLGNTRTVVRSSYVHGDMADTFREKKFLDFFEKISSTRKKKNLSKTESQLLAFLEFLFEENFAI